jgi:hypothetical protein
LLCNPALLAIELLKRPDARVCAPTPDGQPDTLNKSKPDSAP